MKICVFCSSNNWVDTEYFRLTEQLGEWMGSHGHTLVYGGHDEGLMECLAKAVHQSGGTVIGVIPQVLLRSGHTSQYVDVCIPCESLADRKQLMLDRSDAVVALPGGLGTLDEIFTTAASATLAYHQLRVVAYDMKGFWKPLEALLYHLCEQKMMRGDYHRQICFATTLEELTAALGE